MKNKLAEKKPLKVGEPLTDNADGNTEPSISNSLDRACVETRRGVCIKCGNEIPQNKYKSAKFCSTRCRTAFNSHKCRIKKGFISKPFVGSGNNQTKPIEESSGRIACNKAREIFPKLCNRCGNINNLVAHHIDHDRTNNNLSNFEILCRTCHMKHHKTKNNIENT